MKTLSSRVFIWMRAVDRDTWTNSCSSFNRASDPWPRTDPRPFAQILLDDEFRRGFQSESSYPINRAQGEHHDATYTFDVFCSLDGFGSHSGNWGGYGGKQGPELLDHRLSQHLMRETMRPAGRQPVAGEVIMTHISTTTAAVGTQ